MNYQKYQKYKAKYLESKNIEYQVGGKSKLSFDESIRIYKKVIETSEKLEKVYETFWTNVYYNDAYVFHRNAIEYYKNIQNSKFHNFFSVIINKKLYTGSCQFIDNKFRRDFSNSNNIEKIDLDDLCNLSVQIINNLDNVFLNCPKIPHNIITYRYEKRENTDAIFKLKKGDYYKSLGYMSTSINPWYGFHKIGVVHQNKKKRSVIMTIYVPQDSLGYYMNYLFGVYQGEKINKNIGLQEYEILLPRNNIFEVIETKTIDDYLFISLLLRHQMIPNLHTISIETENIGQIFFNKKEYNELDKSKYIECKTNIKNFKKDDIKINIYKGYQILNRNKKPIYYGTFLSDKIVRIDNIHLIKWLHRKPIYDAKKYDFPEKDFVQVYKKFMDLVPLIKKTTEVYINVYILYKGNNELYNYVLNNLKIKKIIKIKKPIVVSLSLDGSIFADVRNFITVNENNNMLFTQKIDRTYPMMIIIKYKKSIEYIPLNPDYGFVFNITKIQITKVDKRYITNDVFYYYVEAI